MSLWNHLKAISSRLHFSRLLLNILRDYFSNSTAFAKCYPLAKCTLKLAIYLLFSTFVRKFERTDINPLFRWIFMSSSAIKLPTAEILDTIDIFWIFNWQQQNKCSLYRIPTNLTQKLRLSAGLSETESSRISVNFALEYVKGSRVLLCRYNVYRPCDFWPIFNLDHIWFQFLIFLLIAFLTSFKRNLRFTFVLCLLLIWQPLNWYEVCFDFRFFNLCSCLVFCNLLALQFGPTVNPSKTKVSMHNRKGYYCTRLCLLYLSVIMVI